MFETNLGEIDHGYDTGQVRLLGEGRVAVIIRVRVERQVVQDLLNLVLTHAHQLKYETQHFVRFIEKVFNSIFDLLQECPRSEHCQNHSWCVGIKVSDGALSTLAEVLDISRNGLFCVLISLSQG